jgi:glutathione synthase/RimK-type ligase-like ATP-grasp enzyme
MATDSKVGTAALLFVQAEAMGLEPLWLTPGGLFVVTTPHGERYINFARSPLNSHVSASLARDKYLARSIMAHHRLPNIPYRLCETRHEARQFLAIHHTIIVKPIRGSGSRDIHIVTKPDQLAGIDISRYICEKYIAGKEMRYLVLDGKVIAVHHSEYGTSVAEDRPLQRISLSPEQWDPSLIVLARRVAEAFDMQFTAIDFMVTDEGRPYVLELNSTPGLKWFHAPTSGPSVDVARMLLETILAADPAHR